MSAGSLPGPGDPATWGRPWHPSDPRWPEPGPSDEELEAERRAQPEPTEEHHERY